MTNRESIELAIQQTLDEFQYDDHVTPRSINSGECEAFAEAVNEKLNNNLTRLTTADAIGGNAEKPDPWHVWLTDGQYHYDAEHPEGVDSWASLNFFERVLTKDPSLK